jgi:signal transduction histidine kinase
MDALNTLAKNETLRRIAETEETERKRIARDLHDHVGQEVTALRFTLERLCGEKSDTRELKGEIKIVCQKMEKLDAEVTDLAWRIRPSMLDTDGLIGAIRGFGEKWAADHGIDFDFHASSQIPSLSREVESNLYHIAQEALNNVAKHAHARRVGATLSVVDGQLRLTIEDDGSGLQDVRATAGNSANNGFGLIGMRERAAVVGGTLEIETAPGAGTTILLNVPLADPTSDAPRGG